VIRIVVVLMLGSHHACTSLLSFVRCFETYFSVCSQHVLLFHPLFWVLLKDYILSIFIIPGLAGMKLTSLS